MSRSFFLTTPIYYVNGEPHVGHVFTTLLSDSLARYHRLAGDQTYFLTGVDEHGQKVQQTAEAKKLSCQQWCDEMAGNFRTAWSRDFHFRPDRFIRTTEEAHLLTAAALWRRLRARGHIYKATYEGWYCVTDEAFVTDLNVIDGTDAQGNPCKLSKESGNPCIRLSEENYMFRLSAFQEPLLEFYRSNPGMIVPSFRQAEIEAFLEGGLIDLSISRPKAKIHWGVPVPDDDQHVMYVWIDALANYLTASSYRFTPEEYGLPASEIPPVAPGAPSWPADVHIIGKDIIRFHCIYWPAFLMAAGLDLPRRFFVHGWWLKDGRKISKSSGNAFDPMEVVRRAGLDPFKYFLLREATPDSDPNYVETNMISVVNGELANDIGNLLLRCWGPNLLPERVWPDAGEFLASSGAQPGSLQEGALPAVMLRGDIPADQREMIKYDLAVALIEQANGLCEAVRKSMADVLTSQAIGSVIRVVQQVNGYLQASEPWKLIKKDDEGRKAERCILYLSMEALRICGTLLLPFMPEKMADLLDQLGVPEGLRAIDEACLHMGACPAGTPLGESKGILFAKLQEPKQPPAPAKPAGPSKSALKKAAKAERARKAAEQGAGAAKAAEGAEHASTAEGQQPAGEHVEAPTAGQ